MLLHDQDENFKRYAGFTKEVNVVRIVSMQRWKQKPYWRRLKSKWKVKK